MDFLKMGGYDTLAALKKCSEFIAFSEEDKDTLFRQLCEHGLSSYKITSADLKEKILCWRDSLEPHVAELSMAILFKDFVEVLQLANWSFLIPSKKNQQILEDCALKAKQVLLCDFVLSLTCFLARAEADIITIEQVKAFVRNSGIFTFLADDVEELAEDEEWLEQIIPKYFAMDRRSAGKETMEYLGLGE